MPKNIAYRNPVTIGSDKATDNALNNVRQHSMSAVMFFMSLEQPQSAPAGAPHREVSIHQKIAKIFSNVENL